MLTEIKVVRYLTGRLLMLIAIGFVAVQIYPGELSRRSGTSQEVEEPRADADKWAAAISAADREWDWTIRGVAGGQARPGDPRFSMREDNYARTKHEMREKHISEDYYGIPWVRRPD